MVFASEAVMAVSISFILGSSATNFDLLLQAANREAARISTGTILRLVIKGSLL
jgi:hypothetical protein